MYSIFITTVTWLCWKMAPCAWKIPSLKGLAFIFILCFYALELLYYICSLSKPCCFLWELQHDKVEVLPAFKVTCLMKMTLNKKAAINLSIEVVTFQGEVEQKASHIVCAVCQVVVMPLPSPPIMRLAISWAACWGKQGADTRNICSNTWLLHHCHRPFLLESTNTCRFNTQQQQHSDTAACINIRSVTFIFFISTYTAWSVHAQSNVEWLPEQTHWGLISSFREAVDAKPGWCASRPRCTTRWHAVPANSTDALHLQCHIYQMHAAIT